MARHRGLKGFEWHECRRWWEQKLECPLADLDKIGRRDPPDEEFDRLVTPRPVPVPSRKEAVRIPVRARVLEETRVEMERELTNVIHIPKPVPAVLPGPLPQPRPQRVPGREVPNRPPPHRPARVPRQPNVSGGKEKTRVVVQARQPVGRVEKELSRAGGTASTQARGSLFGVPPRQARGGSSPPGAVAEGMSSAVAERALSRRVAENSRRSRVRTKGGGVEGREPREHFGGRTPAGVERDRRAKEKLKDVARGVGVGVASATIGAGLSALRGRGGIHRRAETFRFGDRALRTAF